MSSRNLRLGMIVLTCIAVLTLLGTACAQPPTPTAAPQTAAPKPVATQAPVSQPTQAPKADSNWPTKNITLVVPYSAGGGFDLQARILAPLLEKYLPQKVRVIVDNQTGASGKIGTMNVMRSSPDGYTIGIVSPTVLAQMSIAGELQGLDVAKINWVGQLSWDPGAVVVNTASGIKSTKDLQAKQYRTGVTTEALFQNKLLSRMLGTKTQLVTFEGSADEVLAGMRGDIELMMDSWPSMKKAVDSSEGKLTPLFMVSSDRVAKWNTVPSAKEVGLSIEPLYPVAGAARLIAAPSGLTPDVQKALEDSVWKALQDPEFAANMEKAGYDGTRFANAKDATQTVVTTLKVFQENRDLIEEAK